MLLPGLMRVIKFALRDIARNAGLAAMTVFILVLMLLSLNVLWSLNILTDAAVTAVKNQVNMSIFLAPTASEEKVGELRDFISGLPEVVSVRVLSPTDVLANFRARYRGRAEVLSALDELGSNPFGPTMFIAAREPSDYKTIVAAFSGPDYDPLIEAKSFDEHEDAIARIETITHSVERVGLGVLALFAVIAFLIIFNTVRVNIYTQRMEIGIQRLVGASGWFIRGPYLASAVIFSLVSVILALVASVGLLYYVDTYVSAVFPNGFSLTAYYRSHILNLFSYQFIIVLILTIISSSLAMRRQLKI